MIDSAQKNITDLATQVNSLQGILSNKQTRGAFGQGQLEAIIADILPKGAYEFQHTLSNRSRPDCAIFMPDSGPLIIDAKFPLEAMTALRAATTEDERKVAAARVKQDITKHISDIAGKYMIPGETQDIALMFIPSESVYADLHERFDDIVQRAQRARVMIVSPTLMVMAIQVIKQVRKDAAMREAADQIRDEVGHMMKDVGLLGERVRKLQTHFGQTNADMTPFSSRPAASRSAAPRSRISNSTAIEAPSAEVIPAPVRRKLEARANNAMTVSARHRADRAPAVPRRGRGLSKAARADRAVPRLLVRAAAGAVGLDAAGVDARIRRRPRHHRAVRAGRHALHREILVGAARRCARCAAAVALARPPPRLAGVHANAADGGDRVAGHLRSGDRARAGRFGALLVATASATQDIVIDAFRVESLPENEQAAGMASYVAAYRIGMLVSTAGALFLVSGFEGLGFDKQAAWTAGYIVMAALVLIGMVTTLGRHRAGKFARRPKPRTRTRSRCARGRSRRRRLHGFSQPRLAVVALAFVVLFKFTDALAGAMTAPFVIDLGFTRNEYAAIVKGVGLAATLVGGFAGGFVARAFRWPPACGSADCCRRSPTWRSPGRPWSGTIRRAGLAITLENFTSAIGTVIFVAYLSALCRNPLHTATQYALLTALAAVGRTYLSSGAGFSPTRPAGRGSS